MLPIANELLVISKDVGKLIGGNFDIPMSIEFMFPSEIVNKAIENSVLVLDERKTVAKDSELSLPINLSSELSKHIPDEFKYLAYVVKDSSKKPFSTWVSKLAESDFVYFQPLFETLSRLSKS